MLSVDQLAIIREERRAQGLSQQRLASMADVSLATLQNIEAGRANPELSTLGSILRALNLQLQITSAQISWEPLVALGMPLLLEQSAKTTAIARKRRTRSVLLDQLRNVSTQIGLLPSKGRERDAFLGLLVAIRDHYASVWNLVDPKLKEWLARQKLDGRHIKLRRIALANISEYL